MSRECIFWYPQGIDVADCAFVIRFSQFNTTKAHIQGAGRARAARARVFYFENEPAREIRQAQLLDACAKDESLALSEVSAIL